MAGGSHSGGGRFLPALILTGGSWYALEMTGPLFHGPEIQGLPAMAAGMLAISGMVLIAESFALIGNRLEWWKAISSTNLRGSARWLKSLHQLGDDYVRSDWGPYWGAFKGREIIAKYESIALTAGTTGSGKSVSAVIPNALSITDSKVILDFKGSLTAQLAGTLRDRGETVRVLNFSNHNIEHIGETDQLNPTCVISDCFGRPGGLLEVNEILEEMTQQLLPEPSAKSGPSENEYWRNGSRSLMQFAIMTGVLIDGERSTLADANRLLLNRDELLKHALWAIGKLVAERPIDPANAPESGSKWGRS